MKLRIEPVTGALSGSLRPPGDKSISHRAAIFGGLARGQTHVTGFLLAEDTLATLNAMAALGARVDREGDRVTIDGRPLKAPAQALDLGNSGTGIRLIAGALAGHPDLYGQRLQLIGDRSLSVRPMMRIIKPLSAMGARIEGTDGHAPLNLVAARLAPIRLELPVASAQVKSAILLAALNADGVTEVAEPGISRDHTERLLPAFGVRLERAEGVVRMTGPQTLSGSGVSVPGDLSSAAFMIAAAALVPGSKVEIRDVGVNPTRDGFLRILQHMGGQISRVDMAGSAGSEPVATLTVEGGAGLRGFDIPADWVPLAIDEFPVIMALAAVAGGTTVISGAAELRVKESDRLAVMTRQLRHLGVAVDETPDGAVIHGGRVRGGEVESEGDHRIAMSLAVLALVAEQPVIIDGAEWIRTSYPGFVDDLNSLGAGLQWQ
ncbi:MAG: 3-phosphoshikimate 1-carboxyvinyltransferase [Xanthomonadaceae bacterium]|nr:3-phosphoshikimate 1-carboxyvinyltransferase [Xanthomonadaceae bacterium]